MLGDLWGRRRTLMTALLAAGVAVVGFWAGGSFWFLLTWAALNSFLFNPIGPLTDSLTLDYLDRVRSPTYSGFRLWGSLGWTAGAYAAGFLIGGRDIRLMFVVASAQLLVSWFLVKGLPPSNVRSGQEPRETAGVTDVLRTRPLMIFLALVMVLEVGLAPFFSFFPLYMTEMGASRQLVGLSSGLVGLVEVPLLFWSSRIIGRLGHIRTIALAFVFLAARGFLYSIINEPWLATAAQLLHAPFALFVIAAVEYVGKIVPTTWRATGQSLLAAIGIGGGSIIGNALAGLVYENLGARRMYSVAGVVMLLGAAALVALIRDRPSPSLCRAPAEEAQCNKEE
jgi:PPP family 3-phenylpropionic acid transporter